MKNPFFIDRDFQHPVLIWRKAITESFSILNRHATEDGVILDLAGGRGPISSQVNSRDYLYILVDLDIKRLRSGPQQNLVADVCRLPFRNQSIGIAFSISSLQYFDHRDFFSECHRVLRDDGILAVHENGSKNPVIQFARLAQRFIGIFHWESWRYRNSIKRYYRPAEIPSGFEVVFQKADGLTTPLVHGLSSMGVSAASRLLPALRMIDNWLLNRYPALSKYAFFNVVHLKKAKSKD
jgi:SAM-dependent methyltransferase